MGFLADSKQPLPPARCLRPRSFLSQVPTTKKPFSEDRAARVLALVARSAMLLWRILSPGGPPNWGLESPVNPKPSNPQTLALTRCSLLGPAPERLGPGMPCSSSKAGHELQVGEMPVPFFGNYGNQDAIMHEHESLGDYEATPGIRSKVCDFSIRSWLMRRRCQHSGDLEISPLFGSLAD